MAGRLSQALLPRWRVMVLAMAVAFSQATTGADADSATAVPVDYSYSALSVPVLVALLALCTPCALQLPCSCCLKASRRRARPDHVAVPRSPHFTVEWLNAALRRSGLLETGVSVSELMHSEVTISVEDDAAADDVINGGGLAGGRTVRIRDISYTGPATNHLPKSMIQKWCDDLDIVGGNDAHPDSLGERIVIDWVIGLRMAKDKAMVNEIVFYRDLASEVVAATGLRLPKVYYSGIDGDADTNSCLYTWRRDSVYCRTTMLLEDLSASGFEECGHVVLGWEQQVPLPVCEAALTALARLHAWGWGGRSMPKSNWTALLVGCAWAQHMLVLPKWGKNNHLQRYIDLYYDHPEREWLHSTDVQEMLFDLRASLHRWFPLAKALSRTQTTIHGDYHRGNLFYDPEHLPADSDGGARRGGATSFSTNDIVVIDWAMLGSGHCAWELAYFMMTTVERSSSAPAEEVLAEEDRLLALYHAELIRKNPSIGEGYSLGRLQRDVKLVWACHLVAAMDEQGSADSRATDTIVRRGSDSSQPTVQGFGNTSIKHAGALLVDHSMRVLIKRFLLLRQRGDRDLFGGGSCAPERSEEEAEAKRAKARADYEKKLVKKEKEGVKAPWEAFYLPWEKEREAKKKREMQAKRQTHTSNS